jgi:hypothetical protein
MKTGMISADQFKSAREKMARGIIASLLGAFTVACSGCGGGGGGSAPAAATAISAGSQIVAAAPISYPDGRPAASYRLNATDQGAILKHGNAPGGSDALGARDVYVYQSGGTYYMTYDGSGASGWVTNLATSTDLTNWSKYGAILGLGASGAADSSSASYGIVVPNGNAWQMFYLGTQNASASPNDVPEPAYVTMTATAASPSGPWTKQYDVTPFRSVAGSYYNVVASPGAVMPDTTGGYMMFFAAGTDQNKRTLGIARTTDLDGSWTVDAQPILPNTEQIENSSIYYQQSTGTWFLFTNHVGIDASGNEYTDAVWIYWTQNPNSWNPANKAVVIDSSNESWSSKIVGLPSVIQVGGKLAIFYDGQAVNPPAGSDWTALHMNRDIGLAWLDLPIKTPN